MRVVLPTASPGVFSAIMIGFGRAVGETMIVLMATGNTPVLDWSIFNGMRTLSANIAVEIPEAPHGGTLYRVAVPGRGAALHHDLRREHRRRGHPPAPARALPGPVDERRRRRERSRRGDPFIWLTGSALGHLPADDRRPDLLILVNGLGFFWPSAGREADAEGRQRLRWARSWPREPIPQPGTPEHNSGTHPAEGRQPRPARLRLQVDRRGPRSRARAARRRRLSRAARVRALLGTPVRLMDGDQVVAEGARRRGGAAAAARRRRRSDRAAIRRIEKDEIGGINYRIEQARLDVRELELQARGRGDRRAARGRSSGDRGVAGALRGEAGGAGRRWWRRQPELRALAHRRRRRRRSCATLDVVPRLSRQPA